MHVSLIFPDEKEIKYARDSEWLKDFKDTLLEELAYQGFPAPGIERAKVLIHSTEEILRIGVEEYWR